MTTVNVQQGELTVDALTIVNPEKESIDITALTSNITIFEAIDKPFLSGRITLIDGIDVLKNYKIVGQESLTIKIRQAEGRGEYSTPEFSLDKVFRIYSVTDVKRPSQNTMSYVLHFIDPKFFTCQKTTVSQTLRGSYSGMLLKVLQEYAGFKQLPKTAYDKWDESEPEHNQFIIPNWNINRFISYVCANAELKGNKTFKNSMFFYQTMNGEFRFDSFQSMTAREFPLRFSYMPRNSKTTSELDVNAQNEGLNTQILNIEVPQRFNTIKGLTSGAYSSKLLTYDPIRKLEEENVYSISKVFERGNNADGHVSAFPMIRTSDMETTYKAEEVISSEESPEFNEEFVDLPPDASYDSKRVYKVNMTNSFSDEAKLVDASAGKSITQQKGQEYRDTGHLERAALLSLMEQSQIRATIPFRSDMTVGTVINLDIPTAEKKTDDTPGDEMLDGRYLIGKLTYRISPLDGMGTLTMQAIKESYGVDIKEYKPLSKNPVGPEKE
jgi:hypothetical protein